MFTTESEKRDFAIKPMNCPGHVQIFNSGLQSYRDLPLRYGEFGACHRNEPSGALHGIMRVRAFTQDDGHIFCTEDADRARVRGVPPAGARRLPRLRVHRHRDQARAAANAAHRHRRAMGRRRGRAARRAARLRRRMDRVARRRRVLRPEDRIPPQGLDRPLLAGRHDAGRLLDARAPRRRVRGRGQQPARCRSCCTGRSSARWSGSSAS